MSIGTVNSQYQIKFLPKRTINQSWLSLALTTVSETAFMGTPQKKGQKNTHKLLNYFDKMKLLQKESSLFSKASLMKTLNWENRVTIDQLTPFIPTFFKEGGSKLDII